MTVIYLLNTNFFFKTHLFNKARHSYICCVLPAKRPAGPFWLNFFVDTHGWPGGVID